MIKSIKLNYSPSNKRKSENHNFIAKLIQMLNQKQLTVEVVLV